MSARSRKILQAWWLLVIMALVVTPRGLLHHCELLDHHPSTTGASMSAHCIVCDEVLPVSTGAETISTTVALTIEGSMPDRIIVDPQLGHLLACSDRGPPARGRRVEVRG